MAARTSGSIEEEAGEEFEDEAFFDEIADVEEKDEEEDERNGAGLFCRERLRSADAAGWLLMSSLKRGALGELLG